MNPDSYRIGVKNISFFCITDHWGWIYDIVPVRQPANRDKR